MIGAGVISVIFDKFSKWVLEFFLSSDVEDMMTIINREFAVMIAEYDCDDEQVCQLVSMIQIDEKFCLMCYTKTERSKYVRKVLESHFELLSME